MRLITALLTSLALLAAQPALAACRGDDLRETLTSDERAWLEAELAGMPHAEGNHWRATRGGTAVHLVGTMHLDDPRHAAVMDRLGPLVDNAVALLVEMTPAEQRRLQRAMADDPGLLTLTEGPTLIDRLPEDDWRMLAEAAEARGIPPFMAAKFRPWYLSMMLSVPPCAMEGMRGQNNGLDSRLIARAEAANVPLRSLEDYETVFRIFDDEPMEEQLAMMQAGLLPVGVTEDNFATLLDAYFEEKVGETWLMGRIVAERHSGLDPEEIDDVFADMRIKLLDRRNRAWMPVILDAAESAQEDPVVVAVGGAHLIGDAGLPALLEDEGFTLERQPF